MSAIKKELVEATGLKTVRGEDAQVFIARLTKEVAKLDDKAWDGLSKAAQDYFNDCADAQNANAKTLPVFPDAEDDKKEEDAPVRRGRSSPPADTKAEDEKSVVKVGDSVAVTTKRGKVIKGNVVELDKSVMVVETADGEEELNRDRIESVEIFHGSAADAGDDADATLKVGDEVEATTKRGKTVVGKIVEIDGDVIVVEADGKETEHDVADVKLVAAEAPAAKPARRGSTSAADAKEDKAPRSTNNGVSIGTRIKEIIAENLKISEADLGKQLKKEGLEFRDNTLKLNYTDCMKFIDVLRAKKIIKG